MTKIMQGRLQERSEDKRETMTSLDYIIRLTDKLRRGRLTTCGRDYKNRKFHHYCEGYFHIEACYNFVKDYWHRLEPSYYENMLRPYHLDGKHAKTVTTTCLEQQPLQDLHKLDPQQHHMFRTTVEQLIWASLDRPDLMYGRTTSPWI